MQVGLPKPQYNLEIKSIAHGAMTVKMLKKIDEVILKEKPDWDLVYGDTNLTLAGALVAKRVQIKVAHVDAGLPSFAMEMLEEINPILTHRISDSLFCPTQTAMENLEKEGFCNFKIQLDPMW